MSQTKIFEECQELCEARGCENYAVEEGVIKLCEEHRYLVFGKRLKEAKEKD